MLSEKERTGFLALQQTLSGNPLIKTSVVRVLYPGSGERLEHVERFVTLLCDAPRRVEVILVDPAINWAVLEKKCARWPHLEVHAYEEEFSEKHIPQRLTMYIERAFDLFRDQGMWEKVVRALPQNGLVVTDASLEHPQLVRLALPDAVRAIGFYPFFRILRKR